MKIFICFLFHWFYYAGLIVTFWFILRVCRQTKPFMEQHSPLMQTYYYFFCCQSQFIYCFLLFQDNFNFPFIFFEVALQLKSGKESSATDFLIHFHSPLFHYFADYFEFYYLYFHLYVMRYLKNYFNNHFSIFLLLDHLSVHQWHLIDHH